MCAGLPPLRAWLADPCLAPLPRHRRLLRSFNVLESPSVATAVLEVFVALFFLWYMGVEVMACRKYGKKYLTSVR